MIAIIKRVLNIFPKSEPIYLGRWAIKNSIEECNRYMINLHADPGYINPFRQHPEKYIDVEKNIENRNNKANLDK